MSKEQERKIIADVFVTDQPSPLVLPDSMTCGIVDGRLYPFPTVELNTHYRVRLTMALDGSATREIQGGRFPKIGGDEWHVVTNEECPPVDIDNTLPDMRVY